MAPTVDVAEQPSRPTSQVTVDVMDYNAALGVGTWWDEGTLLRTEELELPEKTIVISGNAAGLRSLARHLLTLAQSEVPDGQHLDFDTYCGWLEAGSAAIRIELDKRN